MLAVVTLVAGGTAFAAVENAPGESDGIWSALTTMTTVGYGDISPTTDAGRVIAIVVMLVGIAFLTTVIAAVAERFVASSRSQPPTSTNEDLLRELRLLTAVRTRSSRTLHRTCSTTIDAPPEQASWRPCGSARFTADAATPPSVPSSTRRRDAARRRAEATRIPSRSIAAGDST